MNRNIPPPPLHITIILNRGLISCDERAAMSYWKLMSPDMSRVTPRYIAEAPRAVEVQPSMPLTPRLQSERCMREQSINWA